MSEKVWNIYVASSWRNERQPEVVQALRNAGFEVYDFRTPSEGNRGFHWSEIDPKWQAWTPAQYRRYLNHPTARAGFSTDMKALDGADIVVLVMPCGRSAHLEFGYLIGRGRPGFILLSDGEPELMYRMACALCLTTAEVVDRCIDHRAACVPICPSCCGEGLVVASWTGEQRKCRRCDGSGRLTS